LRIISVIFLLFCLHSKMNYYEETMIRMEAVRQQIKADAIANGRPWSLIQQFSIPSGGDFPPSAQSFDNFGGWLYCSSIKHMYTIYPIHIVEVLNDFYNSAISPYDFCLADIDTIITLAFPDHYGMVERGSFLELASYDKDEVHRRIVDVLTAHYPA
jgi:hypothetical protein